MAARRILLLLITGGAAWAQKPVINPGGVVNAASFAASGGSWLAPGSIASIFGQNFASGNQQAMSVPLPFQMAGVQVTFDTTPAALFYVSPGQINVQVPSTLIPYGGLFTKTVNVIVSTPTGASDPVSASIAPTGPGIFTLNATGCGQGAVLNTLQDGTVQVHGSNTSVQAGDWISVYFTGMGIVGNQPPDGQPSSYTPPSASQFGPGAFAIGGKDAPLYGTPGYWGKAPETVGEDQTNIQIPIGSPEGCRVPLRLPSTAGFSQPVPLSIHTGRGVCVLHPASLGLVEWRKTYFNNAAPAEQIYLRLNQAEANTFPPIPQPGPGYTVLAEINAGPDCANLLPLALDAGTLTVQVPGGQISQATPLPPGGETTNSLPPGTVGAGTHIVTTLGGKEVGPFSSTVTLPPPIQVTSQFPPGSTISCSSPLTINWTGADDQSLVDIKLRASPGGLERYLEAILPGSAGTFTFNPPQTGFPPMTLPFPIGCNVPAEIDVTQMPTATTVGSFSANGLTLGGRSTWRYQFQFRGLQLTGSQ